jgi:hypothetical protein
MIPIKRKCFQCRAKSIIEGLGREFFTVDGEYINLPQHQRAVHYHCPNGHNDYTVINLRRKNDR